LLNTVAEDVDVVSSQSGFENKIIQSITFKNLRFTEKYVVLRELNLKKGDPFKQEIFEFNLRALEKLDIFAEIKTKINIVNEELDIIYSFKEIPLFIPHPTGEYTDENGISLGAGLISTNLWGRNHSCEGSYKWSPAKDGVKRASLEYTIPRVFDKRLDISIWLADERRQNKMLQLADGNLADSLQRPIFNENYQIARLRLFQHLIYSRQYELLLNFESSIEVVGSDTNMVTLSSGGEDLIPGLSSSLVFDSRNYTGNPSKGLYCELGFFKYGGVLGGDVNYVTGLFDFRYYHPVSDRQHLVFSHLSTLQSGEPGTDIPIYRRFFLGGSNTIRGYDLGEDEGKNQLLFSMEYRYLLMKPRVIPLFLFDWYLDIGLQPLLGIDVGTAWDESLSKKTWLNGATAGVQILVPIIQMVRLELGFSEFMEPDNIGFSFHFSTFSKPIAQRFRRR
jgi:outer membrane protein insertion porin family